MNSYETTIAFRESPTTQDKPFPERMYRIYQGRRDAQFSPWTWSELPGTAEFSLVERNKLEKLSIAVNAERRKLGIL